MAEREKYFLREASTYKASATSDYMFVVGCRPTFEAEHFVGWRLSSPEERDAALRALPLKARDIHLEHPLIVLRYCRSPGRVPYRFARA